MPTLRRTIFLALASTLALPLLTACGFNASLSPGSTTTGTLTGPETLAWSFTYPGGAYQPCARINTITDLPAPFSPRLTLTDWHGHRRSASGQICVPTKAAPGIYTLTVRNADGRKHPDAAIPFTLTLTKAVAPLEQPGMAWPVPTHPGATPYAP